MFFDPGTRELLRTWPSPLTWDHPQAPRRPPGRAAAAAIGRAGHRATGRQQHRHHHGRRPEDRPGPHPRAPDRHCPRRLYRSKIRRPLRGLPAIVEPAPARAPRQIGPQAGVRAATWTR
jgi:hypothetical protein